MDEYTGLWWSRFSGIIRSDEDFEIHGESDT